VNFFLLQTLRERRRSRGQQAVAADEPTTAPSWNNNQCTVSEVVHHPRSSEDTVLQYSFHSQTYTHFIGSAQIHIRLTKAIAFFLS
jgi:hypothetical protein